MFDVTRQILKFYSIEDGVKYDIQARGKFEDDDIVYLGYTSAVSDTFTISIDEKEGKMLREDVYLYDNSLNIWHDLSEPYTFSTIAGTFNTRFFIKYEEPEEDDDNEENEDNKFSDIKKIDKVEVYDITGRLINTLDCLCLDNFSSDQIFILKIYDGNKIITKKFLNKL